MSTNPVPKKRKDKRSVAEIFATIVYKNKTEGDNIPRKQNKTQGRKQGWKLKTGIGKKCVHLRYHKPSA